MYNKAVLFVKFLLVLFRVHVLLGSVCARMPPLEKTCAASTNSNVHSRSAVCSSLPAGFVYLSDIDSSIAQEIRYASYHNFVGRPIDGYIRPYCILTKEAAASLSSVQRYLLSASPPLSLKVYDCYRPKRAVMDFYQWSLNDSQVEMQNEFYPWLSKADLFKDGYIVMNSSHCRGSTMDLTITLYPANPGASYSPHQPLVPCTFPAKLRFNDASLDFGTGFDCFDPLAHTANPNTSSISTAYRELLSSVMKKVGNFTNYDEEWWHYTLDNEPFPDTEFDFPVE